MVCAGTNRSAHTCHIHTSNMCNSFIYSIHMDHDHIYRHTWFAALPIAGTALQFKVAVSAVARPRARSTEHSLHISGRPA